MPQQRPRVVIVGAGFGGLEAAKALSRAAVDVIVVDRQNHHCFQPLLYQVATAALSPAEIAWPIRHMLRQQPNATVFMVEVRAVDLAAQFVETNAGPMPYDYLVIATGATHSYFGHDDWAEFAPGLKRIEDATRIRRSILLAFEQAELAGNDAERQRLLTFVIVGGGATGVEMAGAIAEIARQTLAKDFRRIDPRSARIILLEAGPRVLPTLPEDLSRYAERALTRMGVDVRTSTRVTSCDRRPGKRGGNGVWEHPDRNASAIKWRKWKQVEHGQHDIDDQCVLEILCDPWCRRFWQVIDKVKGERGENGERNVHGRPSRSYPDHVASWVAECSKIHRHRLGITEHKRRVQQQ